MLHLVATRRFGPLFITQFLGAFNDNVYKAALLLYLTFQAQESLALNAPQWVTWAGALFILPFLLLSSIAGQLAESHERAQMTRIIKLWEIVLMIAAAFFLATPATEFNVVALMVLIFLMGVQSCFFGPIKYSLIPEYLKPEEVPGANGLVGASTFIAILIGTIVGTWLTATDNTIALGITVIVCAVLGWLSSLWMPSATIAQLEGKTNFNPFSNTPQLWRLLKAHPYLYRCLLGISWFWAMGSVFLTQMPVYTATLKQMDKAQTTSLLAIVLIGIGVGALLSVRLSPRPTTPAYLGRWLVILGSAIVVFAGQSWAWQVSPSTIGLNGQSALLLFNLFFVAIAGGLFVIPIYVAVQLRCPKPILSRIIAANNILNSLFIIITAGLISIAYAANLSVIGIFLFTGLLVLAYFPLRPTNHDKA